MLCLKTEKVLNMTAYLIGSPTVDNSLIDTITCMLIVEGIIVGFGLQSFRVSTKTIRLLAHVFYER